MIIDSDIDQIREQIADRLSEILAHSVETGQIAQEIGDLCLENQEAEARIKEISAGAAI